MVSRNGKMKKAPDIRGFFFVIYELLFFSYNFLAFAVYPVTQENFVRAPVKGSYSAKAVIKRVAKSEICLGKS